MIRGEVCKWGFVTIKVERAKSSSKTQLILINTVLGIRGIGKAHPESRGMQNATVVDTKSAYITPPLPNENVDFLYICIKAIDHDATEFAVQANVFI